MNNVQEMNLNNQNLKQSTEIQGLYHEDGDNYFIKSDCIFTDGNILKLNHIYELTTFLEDGINLRYIKLMGVFLNNSEVMIIAIDIQSNEVLKRSKNLLDDCNNKWLIVQPLYLSNTLEKKVKQYCERLSALHYCRNKYREDLFKFS